MPFELPRTYFVLPEKGASLNAIFDLPSRINAALMQADRTLFEEAGMSEEEIESLLFPQVVGGSLYRLPLEGDVAVVLKVLDHTCLQMVFSVLSVTVKLRCWRPAVPARLQRCHRKLAACVEEELQVPPGLICQFFCGPALAGVDVPGAEGRFWVLE